MIHVWHVFGAEVPESDAAVTRVAEFVSRASRLPAPVERMSGLIGRVSRRSSPAAGAASGSAPAKRLAADGAHVTICGRTEDRLREPRPRS